jgi:superfamily I DNA and/or RNA helicase
MLQAHPYVFQVKHFSLAIVDEASQILEPALIGLLSSTQIDRFVLIGDHKQLPAVVQQDADGTLVDNPLLQAIGISDCRQSFFQRLYNWEVRQGRKQFIGLLNHQGRMHPEVALFANEHFYESQLQIVPRDHQLETRLHYDVSPDDVLDRLLADHRVLFLPVVPAERPPSDKSNEAEARVVAEIVRRLQRFYGDRFDAATTVGIIVPYRNQIATIRESLAALSVTLPISIDTVERYQGSQRDVIIYSFTVSRYYQLDFLTANTFMEDGHPIDRKLNVALTRARQQTIMVGNPDILRQNNLFRQLIEQSLQTVSI